MADLKKIAEEISKLSLLEAVELKNILKVSLYMLKVQMF